MSLRPRHVAVVLAGLGYVIATQWLMTRTPPSPWSAVGLLTPMLALAALAAWRSGHRFWSLGAAVLIAVLLYQAATGSGLAPERLYLLQYVAIHGAFALGFGSTLRPGARPLITRLAQRVHRGLTPAMEIYTRKVTAAWTLYFVAMGSLSVGIYLAAPFGVWVTFANLVTPLAVLLMFAGEFALRYRLHPEFERATMRDAIRAYSQMHDAPPVRGPEA